MTGLTIGSVVARVSGRRGRIVAEDRSESEPRWRVLWEGSIRPQWEYTDDLGIAVAPDFG